MSPSLHERMVLRPTNTPSPIRMPGVHDAFRVEQTVVVDDHVAADVDLVGVTQHDVLSEHDVAAAGPEQRRIERLPQRQTQRASPGLSKHHDELIVEQRPEAGAPDDQLGVLPRGSTCPPRTAAPALYEPQPCCRYHSSVRATPSRTRTLGSYPSTCLARVMSNARLFVKNSTRRRRWAARCRAERIPLRTRRRPPETAIPASAAAAAERPATCATVATSWFNVGASAPREDVSAVRGGGCFSAQPEPFDEIVDVREMVIDLARCRASPSAPDDAAKQLQQSPVARAVDAGWPGDGDLDARARPGLPRQLARLRASSPDRCRRAGAAHPRSPADARCRRGRRPCCSGPRAGRPRAPPPRRPCLARSR